MGVRKIWKKAAEALARARTPRQFVVVKRRPVAGQKSKMTTSEKLLTSASFLLAVGGAYYLGLHESPSRVLSSAFFLAAACLTVSDKNTANGRTFHRAGYSLIGCSMLFGGYLGLESLGNTNCLMPSEIQQEFVMEITQFGNRQVSGFYNYKTTSLDSWVPKEHRRFLKFEVSNTHIYSENFNKVRIDKTVIRQDENGKDIQSVFHEDYDIDPKVLREIYASSSVNKSKIITKFDKKFL